MSRNSSIYMDTRRWAGLCDFCGGEVVNDVCTTCQARFANGVRVREWKRCPTCKVDYKIKDGHQCAQLERE